MTFLEQIAAAKHATYDILQRKLLADMRDEIADRVFELSITPTTDNMRALVGAWTRAFNKIERITGADAAPIEDDAS
jgi:hypothetical protein